MPEFSVGQRITQIAQPFTADMLDTRLYYAVFGRVYNETDYATHVAAYRSIGDRVIATAIVTQERLKHAAKRGIA